MKKIALLALFILSAQSQIIHKRKLFMLGTLEVTAVAKDTIAANVYIDLAIAESKRIENLISD
jgi:thiamine biosynthesis lipoprotein